MHVRRGRSSGIVLVRDEAIGYVDNLGVDIYWVQEWGKSRTREDFLNLIQDCFLSLQIQRKDIVATY